MQPIRSHYSAPAPRAQAQQAARQPCRTLTIEPISPEEAVLWDEYAKTRPGFQAVQA